MTRLSKLKISWRQGKQNTSPVTPGAGIINISPIISTVSLICGSRTANISFSQNKRFISMYKYKLFSKFYSDKFRKKVALTH